LLHLPFDHKLDDFSVQSQHHYFPADGRAHHGRLRIVPREQQLQRHTAHRLLQLPHCGLAEYDDARRVRTKSHQLWLPHHLRVMPHDDFLAGRDIQSQHDGFPADRRACNGSLHPLPYQFGGAAHGLLQLPHGGLEQYRDAWRIGAGSHRKRVPRCKHMLDMPYNDCMDGRDFHPFLVENSSSIRHLPNVPSNSGRGYKLRHF
jgi:hypothetical protein